MTCCKWLQALGGSKADSAFHSFHSFTLGTYWLKVKCLLVVALLSWDSWTTSIERGHKVFFLNFFFWKLLWHRFYLRLQENNYWKCPQWTIISDFSKCFIKEESAILPNVLKFSLSSYQTEIIKSLSMP